MKKMNLLAVAVLLFQQVEANDSGTTTTAQTYKYIGVNSAGNKIESLSISGEVPNHLNNEILLVYNVHPYIGYAKDCYIYKPDGTYVGSFEDFSNQSWSPSPSDTLSFYLSTSNTLTKEQLAAITESLTASAND